ncbi:MAG: ribonuclease R family protein [Bacteroidia bacterium]
MSKSTKRLTLRQQINQISDKVLGWFRKNSAQSPVTEVQVAQALGMRDPLDLSLLGQALDKLCSKKVLVKGPNHTYQLKTAQESMQVDGRLARIEFTHGGLAFARSLDSDEDWAVPAEHQRRALHGDLVRIVLLNSFNGRFRGRNQRAQSTSSARPKAAVVEILERGRQTYVGLVRRKGSAWYLDPDLKGNKLWFELLIPEEQVRTEGFKAVATWVDWPEDRSAPRLQWQEWLGKPGEHSTEMAAIGVEFGFDLHFGVDTLEEAAGISVGVRPEDLGHRRDFRGVPTLTIDPEDAKDFDDALSVVSLGEGRWEVGVHIADVSYYVRRNTALDRDASSRATSVYMVHQVLPMLPEHLSNLVCSLRPDEDKLCYSAVFQINQEGQVLDTWIGRTCIRSNRRLTYQEAQIQLDQANGDRFTELQALNTIALALRQRRFEGGAIGFETEEIRFTLDQNGFPLAAAPKEKIATHGLIEEWMLLANQAVARKLSDAVQQGLIPASVYRVHDYPDPERLAKLASWADLFGYSLAIRSKSQVAASLNRLIQESEGKPEAAIMQNLAIRSMAKAIYTTRNIGHYGLAFAHYTHFTSPIRRYPDLLVHRLLAHLDGSGSGFKYPEAELERICRHDSEKERNAAMAERAAVRFKQLQMLSVRPNEEWEGSVTSVGDQGAWVTLDYNRCDGLLPMTALDDDRYFYDEEELALVGRSGLRRITPGQRMTVRIAKLDLRLRRLELVPVDEGRNEKFK